MIKYLTGALIGGVAGYFVLHKLIGCSSGTCPITANPYISTVYGIILGALVAGMITLPADKSGSGGTAGVSAATYQRISAAQAKERIDSDDEVIILDVRTEEEYKAQRIPDAVLIPNETITNKVLEQLPNLDAEILIYCRSGNRSAQAAKKLIDIGYTNVYDFGGIIDWPYEKTQE